MFLISAYRAFKAAVRDFYRNIWLSLATIIVMILVLISVNFLLIINQISHSAIGLVQDKIDVSVYFNADVPEDQVYEVQSRLLALQEVKDVTFVSSDDAIVQFKERHRDNKKLLDALNEVGGNPLGSTLIVQAMSADKYGPILTFLENPEYEGLIYQKNYFQHKDVIDKINRISSQTQRFGFIISVIFIFIAIIVLVNSLRLMIYSHHEELTIMKLVGASTWFTRAPFVIESIIYTFVSLIIAASIMYPVVQFADPFVLALLNDTNISLSDYYIMNAPAIWGGLGLGLLVLNVVSSIIATHKYTKV